MEKESKSETIFFGLLLVLAYWSTFIIAWHSSIDQWYLPAGLRLTCLLLMPFRYWPYLVLGEIAGLMTIRVPKAEKYGVLWAYFSPALYLITILPVVFVFKRKFNSTRKVSDWMPVIAAIFAVWTVVAGKFWNKVLDGPSPTLTLENLLKWFIGDYLGVLMIAVPYLLWLRRAEWRWPSRGISTRAAIAGGLVAFIVTAVLFAKNLGGVAPIIAFTLMTIPLAFLTFLYGWNGAAFTTSAVNFALAFWLPNTYVAGVEDREILAAQIAFVICATAFLIFGAHLSRVFDDAGRLIRSETEALAALNRTRQQQRALEAAARDAFFSNEQTLRQKAALLSRAKSDLNAYRAQIVRELREDRRFASAMDATAVGTTAAKALDMHADSLYPLEIETYGLYAALTAPAFVGKWEDRAKVCHVLRGQPRDLSLPLRLCAYRCVGNAMEYLAACEPEEFLVKARAWRRSSHRGITVHVVCKVAVGRVAPKGDDNILQELKARVRAFRGAMQCKHPHRIAFFLSEPAQEVQTPVS